MAVWDRYTHDVAGLASPLTDAGDFDALLDRAAAAQVVMLGEASHGTHEFYQWRANLTQRLIAELGFAFVAVEGDWPDCARVDRSVRGLADAPEDPRAALGAFERWPTWMWANEEVVDFCRWLRRYNSGREPAAKVGFHGLDVYSLWESLRAILLHLREHDPDAVEEALAAYRCFEPYGEDPQRYALATRLIPEGCEDQVVDLLVRMRERAVAEGVRAVDGVRADGRGPGDSGSEEELSAWQNAEVVAGADRYYRAMVKGSVESWNVRDQHMTETLDRLLTYYGPGAKGVVWAHNTHVGDARGTDMAEVGEVNIGQLGRDRYGRDKVVLVGFGCHSGTVVAGAAWGAPMQVMPVPAARHGSLEDILHDTAPERALFVFPDQAAGAPDLLSDWLGHRAIGVVYHPERERAGNYVPTKLGDRYDAFVWLDQTRGVRPLRTHEAAAAEPETWPLGV
jgi:erythromycin esterase-like protein